MTAITPAARAALSNRAFTGVDDTRLGELLVELAPRWEAALEGRRHRRRGGKRQRAEKHSQFELVYVDQVIATLVIDRTGMTHEQVALVYGVDTSTVTRAWLLLHPLLESRGVKVPDRPAREVDGTVVADEPDHAPPPGRLHTLSDVWAYAEAERVELCLDATEVQVRRPPPHKGGRKRYVSGKRRMNTVKLLVVSDRLGRPLFVGAPVPGRVHDATQLLPHDVAGLMRRHPGVTVHVDAGYVTLAKEENVVGPPARLKKDTTDEEAAAREGARHEQSSRRIVVEHSISRLKKWSSLMRWKGARDRVAGVFRAVAALVSDRY